MGSRWRYSFVGFVHCYLTSGLLNPVWSRGPLQFYILPGERKSVRVRHAVVKHRDVTADFQMQQSTVVEIGRKIETETNY